MNVGRKLVFGYGGWHFNLGTPFLKCRPVFLLLLNLPIPTVTVRLHNSYNDGQ